MIASVHRGTKIAPDSPGCRELGSPIFHQPFGHGPRAKQGPEWARVFLSLSVERVRHGLSGFRHLSFSSAGRRARGRGEGYDRRRCSLVLCQIADYELCALR